MPSEIFCWLIGKLHTICSNIQHWFPIYFNTKILIQFNDSINLQCTQCLIQYSTNHLKPALGKNTPTDILGFSFICAQKWLIFYMWPNIVEKISVLYLFRLVCFWFPRIHLCKKLYFLWWHYLMAHSSILSC